jgi:hypothetical protein
LVSILLLGSFEIEVRTALHILKQERKEFRVIVYKGFVTVTKTGRKEVVHTTNSVAFLFADPIRKVVLLISQCREAMVRKGNPKGTIIELPAGRRDLKIGIKGLVVKEALEEIGKRVKSRQVKLLNRGVPLALSPGVLTERMYLAYVETDLRSCIKDSSKVYGLKAHDERIRRRVVSFDELEQMTFEDMKTYAIAQWFLKEQLRKGGR